MVKDPAFSNQYYIDEISLLFGKKIFACYEEREIQSLSGAGGMFRLSMRLSILKAFS